MQGDILLFKSSGTWYERVICKVTKGPFTHVAIDYGEGKNLAAHPYGITIESSPITDDSRIVCVPVVQRASPASFNVAMEWAKAQVGKSYSWLDILDAGLHALGINLYVGQKDHYDCSALVAIYLDILNDRQDYSILDAVSPNDVARVLGVIK